MTEYAGIDQVIQIARRLRPLLGRLVFLGGTTLRLLITDEAAPEIRNTDDVDVIIKVASRGDYYQLEDKLRDLWTPAAYEELRSHLPMGV